jgi:hypothetical protein
VHKNVYPVHGLKVDVKYATNMYSGSGGTEVGKMQWVLYTPGAHCTGFWKGPINGVDVLEKRKSLAPSGNQVPG